MHKLTYALGFFGVLLLIPCLALAQSQTPPFQRTEVRDACAHHDPLRQVFWGETHLHTAYSFDAFILDTRNTPQDAYRYAQGEKVGLPPWTDTRTPPFPDTLSSPRLVSESPYCLPGQTCQFTATRTAQLPPGRMLDFAAVTDHSEQLGESNICVFEGTESCQTDADCTFSPEQICAGGVCVPEGYNSPLCVGVRLGLTRLNASPLAGVIAGFENTAQNPSRPTDLCGPTGERCLNNAKHVWDKIIQDAEEAYDRTSTCSFSSFIAYEYTAMAANGACSGDNLPCWDQLGTGAPSADCADAQTCDTIAVGGGGGNNLHRNIIFRNRQVPDLPISNVEQPLACGQGPDCHTPGPIASPQMMLSALHDECNPEQNGCEFLSIPHNSNLSRGSMFLMPETLEEAQVRHDFEPLVEMMQIKGNSECRFQAATGTYWANNFTTPDELCDFEVTSASRLNGAYIPPQEQNLTTIPPNSFVRETLKNGIQFDSEMGVNPFMLGFAGGLDNHNGTPGQTDEAAYAKVGAHGVQSFAVSGQILNEKALLGLETNGGALTAVWAEENSRDALFSAMQRRETYATSGTRPTVRFFGGFDLPENMCERGDFAEQGYAHGVPMGSVLEGSQASPAAHPSPRFAVAALMDPGWAGHPGTELERIQIIKGWVDKTTGEAQEQVFDVAGGPNDVSVNLQTCQPIRRGTGNPSRKDARNGAGNPPPRDAGNPPPRDAGNGASNLCALMADPDFDPDEHAFYYARVLENPSCRWNQHYCNARGVNCSQPMGTCSTQDSQNGQGCNANEDCGAGGVCTLPPTYTEWEYQQCCSDLVPKTVQQRAWTSPIWYRP